MPYAHLTAADTASLVMGSSMVYRKQNGRKTSPSSLLMIGQFLTIASILFILSVDDHHGIAGQTLSIKILVAGACLLGSGVVFVFRKFRIDNARLKQLEQELRSTNEEVGAALTAARDGIEARNQLLASVSHRMQGPLKDIVRRSSTLLETDLTGQQRGCAQTSLLAAELLTSVINNVLDYSQLESGKLSLKNVEFEPTGLLREVVELFSNRARSMGLKLNITIDEDLPSLVRGDSIRLRQVLAHLLDNALKFTQRGEIHVSVSEVGLSVGRTKLQFEVKDTGTGISKRALALPFQSFGENGGLRISQDAGTGLGLAVSKKLVELMGGSIAVDSKPGSGSVFRFTVVFECPDSSQEPAFSSNANVGILSAQRSMVRDRRMASRHRVNHPTVAKSKDSGVTGVRVLDVSAIGLRVSMPFRLALNSEVEIRVEGTSISGFVRNCVCRAAAEFHVGIEISEPVSVGGRSLDQIFRRGRL